MSSWVPALLKSCADEGFPLAGVVDIDLAEATLSEHSARYDAWIARGFQGDMQYLVRGADRRKNPRLVLPSVRSVLAVAIPYRRTPWPDPEAHPEAPRYARYLQGDDYHAVVPAKLRRVLDAFAAATGLAFESKICVDTSAVLERTWAALAGLGWIGKNTMLLHPRFGSYLFLGTALLSLESGEAPKPMADYCGNCARCLDSCPTGAFAAPRDLDSRKCISYLTLEKRGEWPVADEARARMGNWVAGCDTCQEACPFNRKPVRDLPDTWAEGWEADDLAARLPIDWTALEGEAMDAYAARVREGALSRIKFPDMRRNLENARRNSTGRSV